MFQILVQASIMSTDGIGKSHVRVTLLSETCRYNMIQRFVLMFSEKINILYSNNVIFIFVYFIKTFIIWEPVRGSAVYREWALIFLHSRPTRRTINAYELSCFLPKEERHIWGFLLQLSSPHREPRLSVLPWGGRPRAPAGICRGGIIIRVRGCAARFCKDGEIQRFSVFP